MRSFKSTKTLPIEVFLSHRNLVWKMALKVVTRWKLSEFALDDLTQEGYVGMIRAWQTWDADKGVKFITYAYPWIFVYMRNWLHANLSIVRPSWGVWRDRNGGGYEALKKVATQDVSLGGSIASASGKLDVDDLLVDSRVSPEKEAIEKELSEKVRHATGKMSQGLGEVDLDVLRSRVLDDDETLMEVGTRWGVSRQAIEMRKKRLRRRLEGVLRRELGV